MTVSAPLDVRTVPPVTKSVMIASGVQIAGAALLIILLFLEWVRGGRIGLQGNGGGGFGILALLTSVVVLYAAVQGLRGQRSETKLFGPNQLAIALALSLFLSNLVFLWVFSTGGAPKWVYVASNAIVYASILNLFSVSPDRPDQLEDGQVRIFGGLTVLCGLAVAAAPLLTYTKLSSVSFTGYEPGAPRIGLLFLIIGGLTVFYGTHRLLKGRSFGDLGPFALLPHATMGLGVLATAPAMAWMISGLWGSDFDPGAGVYVSVLAGLSLFATGLVEARRRAAKGV